MGTRSRRAAAVAAGACSVVMGFGLAHADPVGGGGGPLVGNGSLVTLPVMQAIAQDATINGVVQLTTSPKAGCPTPATGSGVGRTQLLSSLNAGDSCYQWSRSTTLLTTASTPSLTYVPFAMEAVSFAVTANSNLPRAFTLSQLQSIYHCDPAFVGTVPYDVTPLLPQAGSDLRAYWETVMGITDTDVAANVYPCIVNGMKNGAPIVEQTGTSLDAKSIEPFSVGQYTLQANGRAVDQRGNAVLGVISGSDPQVLNSAFAVKRDVYNVIPTSMVGTSPYSSVFVGAGSLVCQDAATIVHYGFAVNPSCGSTSNHS